MPVSGDGVPGNGESGQGLGRGRGIQENWSQWRHRAWGCISHSQMQPRLSGASEDRKPWPLEHPNVNHQIDSCAPSSWVGSGSRRDAQGSRTP